MSDETYVGSLAGQLEIGKELTPISRVNVAVDSGNMYTAGDDSGRTVEVTIPWGTQAMADHILAGLRDKSYQPYIAQKTLLDPAAELGDGITIGGIYSGIYQTNISFDRQMAASVSAPASDEVEDEYPYQSKARRAQNRQLAATRSSITKTAEEIRLEVAGLEDTISVTVDLIDGLTVKDADGIVKIKGGVVTADDLHVHAANIDGTLKANQIEMTGSISWADLAADAQNQVTSAQNEAISAYNLANAASAAAGQANATVSGWVYPGTTQINGSMIMTGTVKASQLLGGYVALLDQAENQVGSIYIAPTTTGTGIEFSSNYGGIRFRTSGNFWVDCAQTFGTNNTGFQFSSTAFPGTDAAFDLGLSWQRWRNVYAQTCTGTSSDRNVKNSIDYDMSRYKALFDRLRPVSCRYNDGTSGRLHVAYVAQDVEDAMTKAGLTGLDFAGLIKAPRRTADGKPVDGEYDYFLRYGEFVPLNTWMIQQLEARVAKLERSSK